MYIVVAGGGRLGELLTKKLKEDNHQVCIIEQNEDACRKLSEEMADVIVICGDATYPEILKEARIDKANVCVATTSRDEDNIIICHLAKEMFNVRRTVARVNDPKHLTLYRHMDVDNPVDSISIVARIVEEEASFNDVINLLSVKRGRLSVVRVDIPEESPVANKFVKDLTLPPNSVLVAIMRGADIIIPSGASQVLSGDEVLAATLIENEKAVIKALVGELL